MKESAVHRTIDGIWRIESAKIISGLACIVRDVGIAEDLAQDALIIALERWSDAGIPDNPGAWLMTTAKRRAFDHLRRSKLRDRKYEELGWEIDWQQEPDWDEALSRSSTSCSTRATPRHLAETGFGPCSAMWRCGLDGYWLKSRPMSRKSMDSWH